jgi:glycogen(starch) synthase
MDDIFENEGLLDSPRRKLRIAYLAGPCEVQPVYDQVFRRGTQTYFGSNYFGQFLQMCEDIDAQAYAVTNVEGRYSRVRERRFIFENRPNPKGSGLEYHLLMMIWYFRLIPRLVAFRPNVLILTLNEPYWFLLYFMPWLGVTVIPSLHAAPWPKLGSKPSLHHRMSWRLNGMMILNKAPAVVAASADIADQVKQVSAEHVQVITHLPTYSADQFAGISPPEASSQFRVLFAGRIEKTKGVYDLLEIARHLDAERPGEFVFDICGDGPELARLNAIATEQNLQGVLRFHGYCTPEKMVPLISASNAWIVPTRSNFNAGYEMVCAEAVLSGRPLITSPACPALFDVRDAAISVQPDNIEQYCDAIKTLRDDQAVYAQKQAACTALRGQFFDARRSWRAKILGIIADKVLYPAMSPA